MIKAILFDADGVVLKKYKEYFSLQFAREYGAPLDEVTEFFKTTFKECQEGRADLKEELEKLLPKWGWKNGTDAFLEYWFTTDVEVDSEVLRVIEEYRRKGIKCYLATDQEKYRGEYLRKKVGLDMYFDECFFSCELGASKSHPEFFVQVLARLNLPASEVAYRDDDKKNVEVAKGLGIDAKFYKDISDLDM
jgi:putative hydrolase of the HAD superfamily